MMPSELWICHAYTLYYIMCEVVNLLSISCLKLENFESKQRMGQFAYHSVCFLAVFMQFEFDWSVQWLEWLGFNLHIHIGLHT